MRHFVQSIFLPLLEATARNKDHKPQSASHESVTCMNELLVVLQRRVQEIVHVYGIKAKGGVDIQLHSFLTSALDGG